MKEEHAVTAQVGNTRTEQEKVQDQEDLLKLSFIPSELRGEKGVREKFAIASVVCGGVSLVSWIVILLGLIISISGIVLAVLGLKSQKQKYARIGLVLSIVGLLAAIVYSIAAARGMLPASYFTTQVLS